MMCWWIGAQQFVPSFELCLFTCSSLLKLVLFHRSSNCISLLVLLIQQVWLQRWWRYGALYLNRWRLWPNGFFFFFILGLCLTGFSSRLGSQLVFSMAGGFYSASSALYTCLYFFTETLTYISSFVSLGLTSIVATVMEIWGSMPWDERLWPDGFFSSGFAWLDFPLWAHSWSFYGWWTLPLQLSLFYFDCAITAEMAQGYAKSDLFW